MPNLPDFVKWDSTVIPPDARPLAGKCVVTMDPPPSEVNGIAVPESARFHHLNVPGNDYVTCGVGTVLAVTARKSKRGISQSEAFQVGDRVIVELLQNELNRPGGTIVADNKRVMAVITGEDERPAPYDWEGQPEL